MDPCWGQWPISWSVLQEKNSNLPCTLALTCSKKSTKYGRNLSSSCPTKSHFLPSLRLLYRLHTTINFSIGYIAKKSKMSHLLQFHGFKSDPGFGGMWQPLESETDPGIFMSSSPFENTWYCPPYDIPKNPPVQGHKLEWPTNSLKHSTQPNSSLQNLLLSGICLLQEPAVAWNK